MSLQSTESPRNKTESLLGRSLGSCFALSRKVDRRLLRRCRLERSCRQVDQEGRVYHWPTIPKLSSNKFLFTPGSILHGSPCFVRRPHNPHLISFCRGSAFDPCPWEVAQARVAISGMLSSQHRRFRRCHSQTDRQAGEECYQNQKRHVGIIIEYS